MSDRKLQQLYQRLGPALFARARRSLDTDTEAEEAVKAVVSQLVKVGKLPDDELLKKGRELLSALVEAGGGGGIDSIDPVGGIKKR